MIDPGLAVRGHSDLRRGVRPGSRTSRWRAGCCPLAWLARRRESQALDIAPRHHVAQAAPDSRLAATNPIHPGAGILNRIG